MSICSYMTHIYGHSWVRFALSTGVIACVTFVIPGLKVPDAEPFRAAPCLFEAHIPQSGKWKCKRYVGPGSV